MPNRLQRLIQSLEETRRAVLEEVEELGAETLRARPHPDKWSILEIVEHLVVTEAVILQGLPDPATLVERPRRFKHRCLYPLVLTILRFAIPVKVPSPKMSPTGQAALADLQCEWEEHHRWLHSYAEGFDPEGLRAVFRHPVAGPISLRQALRMDQLHLRIHLGQIRKLKSPSGQR